MRSQADSRVDPGSLRKTLQHISPCGSDALLKIELVIWSSSRVERYQQHGLAVLVAIGSVGLVNNAWTQQLAKGYFGGSG